jgi:hypothetical protein
MLRDASQATVYAGWKRNFESLIGSDVGQERPLASTGDDLDSPRDGSSHARFSRYGSMLSGPWSSTRRRAAPSTHASGSYGCCSSRVCTLVAVSTHDLVVEILAVRHGWFVVCVRVVSGGSVESVQRAATSARQASASAQGSTTGNSNQRGHDRHRLTPQPSDDVDEPRASTGPRRDEAQERPEEHSPVMPRLRLKHDRRTKHTRWHRG